MAAKCKLITENIYIYIYIKGTCVHISAKFELTTTKTLVSMTVYSAQTQTTICNSIGSDLVKLVQPIKHYNYLNHSVMYM